MKTEPVEETTQKKIENQTVDAITRILSVDLSTYRNHGLKPIAETDKQVFGVMSENCKKLFCIKYDLRREAERIKTHIEKVVQEHQSAKINNPSNEDCLKFQEQVKLMADQLLMVALEEQSMEQIFWNALIFELPKAAGKNLAIREGFQVVEVERTESALSVELLVNIYK